MITVELHVAETTEGNWVAATAASPYFCFESDTEAGAVAIARRALVFYAEHRADITQAREKREQAARPPVFKEVRRELVCA